VRNIAIIGAGQSGLQLACGLLEKNYNVTVYSERTPAEIKSGFVSSSQCMFHTPLEYERAIGLNMWDETCPIVEGLSLSLVAPGTSEKLIGWEALFDNPARSIDQRVKIPAWIDECVKRGGQMIYDHVNVAALENLVDKYDLVVIASGRGDVSELFKRDTVRSYYDKPQRSLALVYVHGMEPRDSFSAIDFSIAPGIGEFFSLPAQTLSGDCHIWLFEGYFGGPMDKWPSRDNPDACYAYGLDILKTYFPDQARLCKDTRLTDSKGVLIGRISPMVKHPIGTLKSGALVYGIGDSVVLNDPISGQGANNASRAAHHNLLAIIAHGDKAFDRAWMQATFEGFYKQVDVGIRWTNSVLEQPPAFRLRLLSAAAHIPDLAKRIANNFNNPSNYDPWWFDETEADKLLACYLDR